MSRILVVDDLDAMRESYAYDLNRLGNHETVMASGGGEALVMLKDGDFDCIILDLEMPGVDGFEVLATLNKRKDSTPVIVYTATGNFDRCVRAVRMGAWAFISKDDPIERVNVEVANALRSARSRREAGRARRLAGEDTPMIGESAVMEALGEQIRRLAPVPTAVLITGESGCGKELVARDLHLFGSSSSGPFEAINCAALPSELVESALFGHEKGAFTTAERMCRGAFELAAGGSLFLDEIGEMPMAAQAKLLRVLEQKEMRRVGGEKTIKVDARVIAATNRNLKDEVAAGRFREDLLYRINTHVISVPPLRDRKEDIPLLLEHLLARTAERFGMKPKSLKPDAVKALAAREWTSNNVRELANVVEQIFIACPGDEISIGHLPPAEPVTGDFADIAEGTWEEIKTAMERRALLTVLSDNGWQISRTARKLGLADHSSLHKIMKRLDIQKP